MNHFIWARMFPFLWCFSMRKSNYQFWTSVDFDSFIFKGKKPRHEDGNWYNDWDGNSCRVGNVIWEFFPTQLMHHCLFLFFMTTLLDRVGPQGICLLWTAFLFAFLHFHLSTNPGGPQQRHHPTNLDLRCTRIVSETNVTKFIAQFQVFWYEKHIVLLLSTVFYL